MQSHTHTLTLSLFHYFLSDATVSMGPGQGQQPGTRMLPQQQQSAAGQAGGAAARVLRGAGGHAQGVRRIRGQVQGGQARVEGLPAARRPHPQPEARRQRPRPQLRGQRQARADVLHQGPAEAPGHPHQQPLVGVRQQQVRGRATVQGQRLPPQPQHQSKA